MAGRQASRLPRLLILLLLLVVISIGKKFEEEDKPSWAKKNIRDYSDADLERLLEQWDVSVCDLLPPFETLADLILYAIKIQSQSIAYFCVCRSDGKVREFINV